MSQLKINRFHKIATKRVNKLLEDIRLLGNCSNRGNYDYCDEDIKKMFSVLDKEYKNLKNKFTNSKKSKEFQF